MAQREGGLGERLKHAVSGAFGREAEAVMLIGGDCAELGEKEFDRAAALLGDADAVLGPSLDGGYFLLGLKEAREEVLSDIKWSTAEVAAQTRERLAQAGMRWSELPALRDVDTAEDWNAVSSLF